MACGGTPRLEAVADEVMNDKRLKIGIIGGRSGYDVFAGWQAALAVGFRRAGVEARVLNPSRAEDVIESKRAPVTMGFNLIREWTAGNISQPHFAWMVDQPVYHASFFRPKHTGTKTSPHLVSVGSVDIKWTMFARQIYGFEHTHFLPHAASGIPAGMSAWGDRAGEPVFFGTLKNPAGFREKLRTKAAESAPGIWPLLEKIMAEYGYETGAPLDWFVWSMLSGMKWPEETALMFLERFFPLLDQFHRYKSRIETLRAAAAKIAVRVYGEADNDLPALPAGARLLGPVRHSEALEIMAHSKLLINHSPTLGGGGHERVFDALARGTAVVTTRSDYLEKEMGRDAGVSFCGAPSEWPAAIETALNAPDTREQAARGGEITAARHTMANRAAEILAILRARHPDVFDATFRDNGAEAEEKAT